MFTVHNFIQWSHEDEDGKFKHVGEVVEVSSTHVTMVISPNGSTLTLPLDEGKFKSVKKPANWTFVKPEKEVVHATAIKKPRKPRQAGQTSKKDQALDIYKDMMDGITHPQRKDVIDQFVNVLSMTPAGASTYAAMCKKEHTNNA